MLDAMDWFISQQSGLWPDSAVRDLERRLLGILADRSSTTVDVMDQIADWLDENENGQDLAACTVTPLRKLASGQSRN